MRSSPKHTQHAHTRGTYACAAPPSTYARKRTLTHTHTLTHDARAQTHTHTHSHTHTVTHTRALRSEWLERALRITSWSMPSPTEVVNAIEPDLSPRTTRLGCLSTTALGCVSSVAGASSTAGAAATAAGAGAAGTSSSGGPSSGAAESALKFRRGARVCSTIRCGGARWRHRAGCAR